ncbi:MAG: cytochrome P450 [Dehalococcoidia bacterium]|nr:cytochrome P450 [Dehalococcoidia bacterium]
MTQVTLTPDEINLNDPTIFERNEQQEVFRFLRNNQPIHWNPEGEESVGYWNITKYEDVMYISRNPQLFSSEKGIVSFYPKDPTDRDEQMSGDGKMLITMDPPRHVKLRRLVNKGFTPRAVRAMEDHIREITNSVLDDIGPKGRCDFVLDVASQLPLAVICGMMGLRKEDWPYMFELTNKVLGQGDPEYQTDAPEELRGTAEGARIAGQMGTMQMFGYFAQQLQERKEHRKDDLISLLVDSEVDGDHLSDEDILWFCFLLILAGNETTRNAISGGLHVLCQHPDQRAELQKDYALFPTAIEEILRWVSPVTHMARVATADAEIRGQAIKEGERLVMWYPSVNRDEDIFPNPDTFDIHRDPNDHLAFGIGEHFCLGAGFARLELRVMFEELFRRFPDIEMDGEPERLRSTFIGGIKHLPVKFTPES